MCVGTKWESEEETLCLGSSFPGDSALRRAPRFDCDFVYKPETCPTVRSPGPTPRAGDPASVRPGKLLDFACFGPQSRPSGRTLAPRIWISRRTSPQMMPGTGPRLGGRPPHPAVVQCPGTQSCGRKSRRSVWGGSGVLRFTRLSPCGPGRHTPSIHVYLDGMPLRRPWIAAARVPAPPTTAIKP